MKLMMSFDEEERAAKLASAVRDVFGESFP